MPLVLEIGAAAGISPGVLEVAGRWRRRSSRSAGRSGESSRASDSRAPEDLAPSPDLGGVERGEP